jgi:hypothetical protein
MPGRATVPGFSFWIHPTRSRVSTSFPEVQVNEGMGEEKSSLWYLRFGNFALQQATAVVDTQPGIHTFHLATVEPRTR